MIFGKNRPNLIVLPVATSCSINGSTVLVVLSNPTSKTQEQTQFVCRCDFGKAVNFDLTYYPIPFILSLSLKGINHTRVQTSSHFISGRSRSDVLPHSSIAV